jgi:hypothetical protein
VITTKRKQICIKDIVHFPPETPRLQGLKSTTTMDGNCKSPSSFFSTEKDQDIIIIIDQLTWHKNPIIENDQTSSI